MKNRVYSEYRGKNEEEEMEVDVGLEDEGQGKSGGKNGGGIKLVRMFEKEGKRWVCGEMFMSVLKGRTIKRQC